MTVDEMHIKENSSDLWFKTSGLLAKVCRDRERLEMASDYLLKQMDPRRTLSVSGLSLHFLKCLGFAIIVYVHTGDWGRGSEAEV